METKKSSYVSTLTPEQQLGKARMDKFMDSGEFKKWMIKHKFFPKDIDCPWGSCDIVSPAELLTNKKYIKMVDDVISGKKTKAGWW